MSLNHLVVQPSPLPSNLPVVTPPLNIVCGTLLTASIESVGYIDSEQGFSINGSPLLTDGGLRNTFLGVSTMPSNTNNISDCTSLGYSAGTNINGAMLDTFIGSDAGLNTIGGSYNSCVGAQSGYGINTASNNSCLGYQSGYSLGSAGSNTLLGTQAGKNLTSNNNTLVGYQSGLNISSGGNNSCVGYQSGLRLTTGSNNTCVGLQAGSAITTGSGNVCSGYQAANGITTGTNNVCVGFEAGQSVVVGANNTIIGGLNTSTGGDIGNGNTSIGYNSSLNGCGAGNVVIGPTNSLNSGDNNSIVIGNTKTGLGNNTFLLDPTFLSANQTTDATNGRFLSHNYSTGLVSSATALNFPFTMVAPGYIGTLTKTISSGGIYNGRVGVVTINIASSLNAGSSTFVSFANSSSGTNNVIIGGLIGTSSATPAIIFYDLSTNSGSVGVYLFNASASTASGTNWTVTMWFYILQ